MSPINDRRQLLDSPGLEFDARGFRWDGYCQSWQSMSVMAKELLAGKGENRLIPFIVAGKSDDPRIKDLPRSVDYIKNKEDLATYKAWLAPYQFFRSFVVPPNMAQERSDMPSKAFKATLEDPELLAMAKKLKLSIQYIPGTEIDQSLTEIFSVTPKVKENLQSWGQALQC